MSLLLPHLLLLSLLWLRLGGFEAGAMFLGGHGGDVGSGG